MFLWADTLHLFRVLVVIQVLCGAWVTAIYNPKNHGPQERIHDGFQDDHDHSAIVKLHPSEESKFPATGADACVGTFITNSIFLTSASCKLWTKLDQSKLAISSIVEGKLVKIDATIKHWLVEPEFWNNDKNSWHADLALVVISKPRNLGDKLPIVASYYNDPISDPESVDKPLTIAGYGLKTRGQTEGSQELSESLVAVETCLDEIDSYWDKKKFFCFTGGYSNLSPTCSGDDGAPIFMERMDNEDGELHTILVGITRGPHGTCGAKQVGRQSIGTQTMATRLSGHLRWIQYTVCRYDPDPIELNPEYRYECDNGRFDSRQGFSFKNSGSKQDKPIPSAGDLPDHNNNSTDLTNKSNAKVTPPPGENSTTNSDPVSESEQGSSSPTTDSTSSSTAASTGST